MEKLKIDVDNRSPFLKRIYLRQGDSGIQTVLINVVSGDDPVDCTGYTVKFKANLCDGKLVTGEAEPKDLTNGEYTYTFKSAESSVYGDVRNAYFQLFDEAGNSISGSNVLITVEKGVDITQDQAGDYVSELDKIIDSAQGKADELAEFAEEEKDKITAEVTDVSEFATAQKEGMLAITADVSDFADSQKETITGYVADVQAVSEAEKDKITAETKSVTDFADSQKGLMTEAVTDVQTFAESEKNDITSIKNDVSGFADEQKATMADKTAEVDNYGDMQKVAMLNKRLEIEQTGNQEKAKILAVLPDVESSIAEQEEQIADLQEKLVDVDLHQAWATGEDGEGFSNKPIGENLVSVKPFTAENTNYTSNKVVKADYLGIDFDKLNQIRALTISMNATVRNAQIIESIGMHRIGYETYLNTFNGPRLQLSLWKDIPIGENFSGIFSSTLLIPDNIKVTSVTSNGSVYIQANGEYLEANSLKIEYGKYVTPYVPASFDDPINCRPKYVGFGIKNSDNYQDYKWILNPEWVNANAIYGTEITTLKDQLADIQTWIQAHS